MKSLQELNTPGPVQGPPEEMIHPLSMKEQTLKVDSEDQVKKDLQLQELRVHQLHSQDG